MNNPDVQQWLLAPDGIATRLRALRGTTTGKVFAEAAGMRASKLSKLELGQQEPTAADIDAIVAAAGQPASVAAELQAKLGEMPTVRVSARVNRFGQVATQKRVNQLLHEASNVRLFDAMYMPRLAQTMEYAAAVLEASAQARGVRSEAREASAVVYSSAGYVELQERRFQMVVAEPVLRWQILPPPLMRAQLEWLLKIATRPNVDFRVLALDRPVAILPPASFALIDDRGFADTLEAADELTGARLAGHQKLMDALVESALTKQESLRVLHAVLAQASTAGAAVRFTHASP